MTGWLIGAALLTALAVLVAYREIRYRPEFRDPHWRSVVDDDRP